MRELYRVSWAFLRRRKHGPITRCGYLHGVHYVYLVRYLRQPAVQHRRGGAHIHHESAVEGGSKWWFLDAVRVSLLNDHVDLGREYVFVQGEVPVVAVAASHRTKHTVNIHVRRENLDLM